MEHFDRDELDLDRLLAEAESAAAEADAALDRLSATRLVSPAEVPPVRSLEERRQAVVEAVEAVTPERQVRTPAERRAAVQRVLEERQREIDRKRREREVQELAAAAPPPPARPEPALPLQFPERPPEMAAAVIQATNRDRRPRTAAQRLADAKQAAIEELERRRREVAARHQERTQPHS